MKIKVGISSCLLGNEVRFDGGHKHSRLCTETLARYFDFVPECPELGIGMTIPRKPIRLIGDVASPQLVAVDDNSVNYTNKMLDYAQAKAAQMDQLCGYVFMKNSPSCGVFRVKVYQENGYPSDEKGQGIFAQAIIKNNPLLPVEEAGRLEDAVLRENFIIRVFAYHNWQQLKLQPFNYKDLIEFHSRYKYCMMAHSAKYYSELGRMLSDAGNHDVNELAESYFAGLMQGLSQIATRNTHTNVLMHLQGYLKKVLSAAEKQELCHIIDQYRTAQVPLIVPITILKHHFNNHPDPYIAKQAYLQPYPDDLSLRNAI